MKIEIDSSELEKRLEKMVEDRLNILFERLICYLPSKQLKHYRPAEIAELLAFEKETVWKWIRLGKLKTIKVGKRSRIIMESELNRFLNDNPVYMLRKKRMVR